MKGKNEGLGGTETVTPSSFHDNEDEEKAPVLAREEEKSAR